VLRAMARKIHGWDEGGRDSRWRRDMTNKREREMSAMNISRTRERGISMLETKGHQVEMMAVLLMAILMLL
jgi:hypothetical protein